MREEQELLKVAPANGQSILIVGCGNIGFSLVQRLTVDGAQILVCDVKAAAYLQEFMAEHPNVSFKECNATDEESVLAALSDLPEGFFDRVFLTVGMLSVTGLGNFDSFQKVIDVNLLGTIVPIRALVRRSLMKKPGKIVVVASTSGYFAGIRPSAYASSKWALVNACESIRSELRERGIFLDLVNPKTIKNERSAVFNSTSGIDVATVTDRLIKVSKRAGSADYFIPGRYKLLRLIEREFPFIPDAARKTLPSVFRRRHYKMPDPANMTALITGSSTGLGRELALLFSRRCSRLYLVARSIDLLNELKNTIEAQTSCVVVPIQADLSRDDAVTKITEAIGGATIDLLINNAAHHVSGSLLSVDLKTIRDTMRTNFLTPVELLSSFRDDYPATVVNVISTTAIAGRRNLGVYSCTKAALWCLSKALRRAFGNRVNVIDVIPATFQSSLSAKGDRQKSDQPARRQRFVFLSSSRNKLTSADVANAVYRGIERKRDTVYIPRFKVKSFLALKSYAPKLFHSVFQ